VEQLTLIKYNMKQALKELQELIDLTGTLERHIYLNIKLKLIKKLLKNGN
jgi:hypothetical protein